MASLAAARTIAGQRWPAFPAARTGRFPAPLRSPGSASPPSGAGGRLGPAGGVRVLVGGGGRVLEPADAAGGDAAQRVRAAARRADGGRRGGADAVAGVAQGCR